MPAYCQSIAAVFAKPHVATRATIAHFKAEAAKESTRELSQQQAQICSERTKLPVQFTECAFVPNIHFTQPNH